MTSLYLQSTSINEGTPVKILSGQVMVQGKCNNVYTPDALGLDLSEVQTNTFENLKYNISGVHLTNALNTLTYNDVLTMYKEKYSGSNYNLLTITYGNGLVLPNLSQETTGIKVILDTFSLPISAIDSKDGKLPILNLTFVETK